MKQLDYQFKAVKNLKEICIKENPPAAVGHQAVEAQGLEPLSLKAVKHFNL